MSARPRTATLASSPPDVRSGCRFEVVVSFLRRLRHVHPAYVLMALDAFGFVLASYLSFVELQGKLPYCGPLNGCEEVALSQYARVGGPNGIPVAVFGVGLSLALFVFAYVWLRTDATWALAVHYGLSLAGTLFEVYFTYLELFVIHAICVWCATYGLSLVVRFLIALAIWTRRPRAAGAT